MTDTKNAFAAAQYEPIPAAARDFVKKAAATARERATTFHAGTDKATRAVEQTMVTAVGEAVQIYVDYMRNGSDGAMARARTARDLFGKLVASGANTGQKTIANDGPFNKPLESPM